MVRCCVLVGMLQMPFSNELVHIKSQHTSDPSLSRSICVDTGFLGRDFVPGDLYTNSSSSSLTSAVDKKDNKTIKLSFHTDKNCNGR